MEELIKVIRIHLQNKYAPTIGGTVEDVVVKNIRFAETNVLFDYGDKRVLKGDYTSKGSISMWEAMNCMAEKIASIPTEIEKIPDYPG